MSKITSSLPLQLENELEKIPFQYYRYLVIADKPKLQISLTDSCYISAINTMA
jgi:hypothetical protein